MVPSFDGRVADLSRDAGLCVPVLPVLEGFCPFLLRLAVTVAHVSVTLSDAVFAALMVEGARFPVLFGPVVRTPEPAGFVGAGVG